MKYWRLAVASTIVIVAVAAALLTYDSSKEAPTPRCGNYRNDKTVSIGSTKIMAEVVKSSAELQKGLSGRPCIESNQAMLFDFGKPGQYAIWMKDMRFPIDIIWIDSNNNTVGVERNVLPSTYPDRFVNKDKPARYVLEMQANLSEALNINLGTPVIF